MIDISGAAERGYWGWPRARLHVLQQGMFGRKGTGHRVSG